jgi:hypothetical protein
VDYVDEPDFPAEVRRNLARLLMGADLAAATSPVAGDLESISLVEIDA